MKINDTSIDKNDLIVKIYVKCCEHFIYEEILMQKSKYKYFTEHKLDHDNQLIKLKEFIFLSTEFDLNKSETLASTSSSMILDWVVPHIKSYDMIFANFYKQFLSEENK
jgi:hemerythrin